MNKQITITLSMSILDNNIFDFIKEEIKGKKTNDCYEFSYDLIIHIKNSDLDELISNEMEFPIFRLEQINASEKKQAEWKLRVFANNILLCVESVGFKIKQIYLSTSPLFKNFEISLIQNGTYEIKKAKNVSRKIYITTTFSNKESIVEVADSIEYQESDFFIDERNNNKTFFNSLLLKKKQNILEPIEHLGMEDWKQLILKEKITNLELSELYSIDEKNIISYRKKFISNVKQFGDEYLFYYKMFAQLIFSDYYSNFGIICLEQMKEKNIQTIYQYDGEQYHELFSISEELQRQKEIEKNNLAGKPYVIPLSGILLKNMYLAIKNNQLDRKILKSKWFNNQYGKLFLDSWVKQLEKSRILDDYETGKIYRHYLFKPYQKLLEQRNQDPKRKTDNSPILTVVPTNSTITHKREKNQRKICPPRDYITLAKVKKKVGKWGEKLIYQYEFNELRDYKDLQKRIEKTYLIDEAAGYDIKSYDYEGNPFYIEVKTSKSSQNNQILFYISKNEDEFISNHKNAYIYYIYDLNNPKLRIINQETYLSFKKEIINYKINQEAL